MTFTVNKNDGELTIALEGRLDTLTAPDLEEKLDEVLDGIEKLTFDFEKLEYISSAGLRVLAGAMDIMEEQGGKMVVKNVCSDVLDVFEVTGFIEDLTIE
ncbi:MAG: STAS domain-containing protein [Ruminiclostridium sp.]|nr:STAS domain-containing protein [Ruminiclostridium sp.]